MNLARLAKKTEKLLADNSPAILTAIGAAGVLTTAYLTGKATFKAAQILESHKNFYPDRGLNNKEKFELIWKLYIPAAGVGALTITSIICANRVSTRRAAAMAAAFSISEKAFDEYKEKVVEKIGEKKEEAVRAEINQNRVSRDNPDRVIVAGDGKVICKDTWSGRYWSCDMETIKKAQNDTNHDVLNYGYCSLTEFYGRVGLEGTKESDNVGWNNDNLLEVFFTTALSDRQEPVLVMDFSVAPIRNYYKSH